MPSSDLIDLPEVLQTREALVGQQPLDHSYIPRVSHRRLHSYIPLTRRPGCTAQQLAERTGTSEASLFRFYVPLGSPVSALRNELEQASEVLESVALPSSRNRRLE